MGYTNIPTDGRGRILITDIGDTNEDALICSTDFETTGRSFIWYLDPSIATTSRYKTIRSSDSRGWSIVRDTNNGISRLRRRSSYTTWTEGVFTCNYPNNRHIYVGIYHPSELYIKLFIDMELQLFVLHS